MRSSTKNIRPGRLRHHGNVRLPLFHVIRLPLHQYACPSATYRQRTMPRPQTTLLDRSPKVQMSNTMPLSIRTRRRKKLIWVIPRPCVRYTRASTHQSFPDSPRRFRASKSTVSRSARKRKDTRLYWIISQETFWIPRKLYGPSLQQACSPSHICA
jgi:hypothetical protein